VWYTRQALRSAAEIGLKAMIGSGNSNPVLPDKRYWFKPGQSGNPGGQAKGARRRLTGDFLNALATHFAENGTKAIQRLYEEDPRAYIGAIVKLCPRELEVTNALDDLDNDALRIVLAAAQRYVQRQRESSLQHEAQSAVEAAVKTPESP
jgi:hypothetical protein